MEVILGLGFVVLLVLFYFLPFIIAINRGHHNTAAIFVLNLFLGWTFLGWVVALVWSFTAVVTTPPEA
ncbi:MAG: superinfection immunity protein [Gammaproteobacteria bacterium]